MAWLSTSSAATGACCKSITYGKSGLVVAPVDNAIVAVVGHNYYSCCFTTSSTNHHHHHQSLTTSCRTNNIYPKLSSRGRRNTNSNRRSSSAAVIRAEADTPIPMTTTIEKSGIKIVNNPPESKLSELGVKTWPKWGCPPSKFPWTYSSKETCYLLKGKVKVYPDGSDEIVEIGAGDLVEFPKGMSCTWDVSEAVDKHYNFD